jgi:colanic acid/amylovoran biosynthesis glycosyltransferase
MIGSGTKKMNIAFFTIEFPAFAQNYILNQITGLVDRRCAVDIYADREGILPEPLPEIEKYGLLQKTFYFRTYYSHHFNHGFSVEVMPYLSEKPYDIIHCQFGPMGLNAETLRRSGAISGKLITSFRGFDMGRMIQTYGKRIYDPLFEKGDLFLPVSESMKQQLTELGCPREKIVVHPTGIDCEKFQVPQRKPHENGKIKLISIARLVEKKGLEYAIRAVSTLSKKYGIEYCIAGDGPLKGKLEQLVRDLNAQEIIHISGWKNPRAIPELLQSSHILLAPSVTAQDGDQEGIPNALKEAMAAGLPVVSTFHSGISELVQDGISGYLAPERNAKILEEKLDHLLTHPETWTKMGEAGREHVQKNYDLQRLNDRLMEIYKNLL